MRTSNRSEVELEIKKFNDKSRSAAEGKAAKSLKQKMNKMEDKDGYDLYWKNLFFDDDERKREKRICKRLKMHKIKEPYSYDAKCVGVEKDEVQVGYEGSIDSNGDVSIHSKYSSVDTYFDQNTTDFKSLTSYWFYYKEDRNPWQVFDKLLQFDKYRKSSKKSVFFVKFFTILMTVLFGLSSVLDVFLWFLMEDHPSWMYFVENLPLFSSNPMILFYITAGIKALILAVLIPIISHTSCKDVSVSGVIISFLINLLCVGIVGLSLQARIDSSFMNVYYLGNLRIIFTFFSKFIFPAYFVIALIVFIFQIIGLFDDIGLFELEIEDFERAGGRKKMQKLEQEFIKNSYIE